MRKPIIIASLLLCAAVFAPEVRAGEIADKAAQAEEHLAAARYEEAMKALEEAQDKLWATAPLMFRRALFTAGEPTGYGLYDLRENNVFKRSDKLIIYSEPMGYGYGRDGSLYVIDLALDFIIRKPMARRWRGRTSLAISPSARAFPTRSSWRASPMISPESRPANTR